MRYILALLLLWAVPAHAVIVSGGLAAAGAASPAYDNASASSPGTGNLSWSHIPTGTPKGIICFVVQYNSGADQVSGITYGGTGMTEVAGSPLLKTTGEAMAVYGYFLGSSVPTGTQTVVATVSGAANKKGYCWSITAGNDTAVVDTTTISSDSVANPSGVLTTGVDSFAIFGGLSGFDTYSGNITSLANWTQHGGTDFGTEVVVADRYNIIQSDNITFGWTAAAEDAVAIGVAIKVSASTDVAAPYTASFNPPNAQTGVSQGTTSAVFHVLDDGNGVDNTTIRVTRTGGLLNTCGDNLVCTGAVGDITVTYPGLSLSYDDNVSFQIGASDSVPNAMDNVSYWFTVQSNPGGGGNRLVGDNTAGGSAYYIQSTANYTYTSSFTASSSGTAATAWIYFHDVGATNCKVDLYAAGDTGALLDSVIVPVSGSGWKSGTLTGGISIASGTSYRLGYTCNAFQRIRRDNGGLAHYCTTGNYTSPSNPNCYTGDVSGPINVYITD